MLAPYMIQSADLYVLLRVPHRRNAMGRGEIDKPLSLKEKHLTGFSRSQKYNPMQACVQATVSNVNWTMGPCMAA